jgi:hypothetical protein
MNNTLMTLLHLLIMTKTAPSLLCLWNLYPIDLLTATSKILWSVPFTKHGMITPFHLQLTPTPGPPLCISISQKRARNKTSQRQGTKPFNCLHLDLMRNPFCYGLTTSTNYSAYLFIVTTTPGKLTGWIGLPTESTTSIVTALKQWLTDTELLGRTQSVRFICTDAGSAFTSTKFILECTSLGIKVEAAAPEHQEMIGICKAKWHGVHNTANILLNNARLGGAFFHHAHAYAVHIVNVCPAKNVIDQNGNPTMPYQYSFQLKPRIAYFQVFGCPSFFKRYEPNFCNKLITYKQQLQRASRGIFLGFPDNSAGWLIYSPDQPQHLVITRNAYFDEDFNSALCFDSKPLLEPYPSAPISTRMDYATLKRTLNHLPTTKLALQSTLANHHPPPLLKHLPHLPLPPSQKQLMMIKVTNSYYFIVLVSTLLLMSMLPFPSNMDQHHLHLTMSTLLTTNTASPSSKR